MFTGVGFFTQFDSDALAFLTAASITDVTISDAIDSLVVGLKNNGLWAKMYAIYPFVGGTSSTHKYNLKDPRDLDAAYRLTFGSGIAHSSNGITNNVTGSNAAVNTFFKPSVNLTSSDINLSIYQRVNLDVGGYDWGGISGVNPNDFEFLIVTKSGGLYYGGFGANPANFVTATNTDARGFHAAQFLSGTTKIYKNGTTVNSGVRTYNALDNNLGIGARINSAFPTWDSPATGHQYAFASISTGLSDGENSNLNTLVQTFNTSLSRNV